MPIQITPAMTQLQSRHGSFDPNRFIRTRWTFYDYIQYPAAGTNKLDFFNIPSGQNDAYLSTVMKTLEHTNSLETRQLPYDFAIKQVRLHIRLSPKARQTSNVNTLANLITAGGDATGYRKTMIALYKLMMQGTLVISLGQKEWYDIPQPFITCPPGFGINLKQHAVSAGTSGIAESCWLTQSPDSGDVYNVPTQLIEMGQTLSASILFDNANSPAMPTIATDAARVEIGLLFDGYVVQPVQ